ncbi:hypothetical protein Hokovirus_1_55 [Hokovirus HKV1]|uniref:Uncharacterized protein n=1 Tax=Hokovirus HKV1 TaxID=1977638 RepID=A0A1V0SEP1_9VIRU|nr:hypothetical protein Hokovirus_1_55 [Hokovirus HKV1]
MQTIKNMHASYVYPGQIYNEKYNKVRNIIKNINTNKMSDCKYNIDDPIMKKYNGKGTDCEIVKNYLKYLYYEHPNNLDVFILPNKDKSVDIEVQNIDKISISRGILNFVYKL